jgi:hypothetical protein
MFCDSSPETRAAGRKTMIIDPWIHTSMCFYKSYTAHGSEGICDVYDENERNCKFNVEGQISSFQCRIVPTNGWFVKKF